MQRVMQCLLHKAGLKAPMTSLYAPRYALDACIQVAISSPLGLNLLLYYFLLTHTPLSSLGLRSISREGSKTMSNVDLTMHAFICPVIDVCCRACTPTWYRGHGTLEWCALSPAVGYGDAVGCAREDSLQ